MAVSAQHIRRDGVKRAARQSTDRIARRDGWIFQRRWVEMNQDLLDSAEHLGGGSSSKREQQNARRFGATNDLPGDSMSQSRRLARSSPRDNQQRLIAMHHRRPLLRVERLKKRRNFRCFGR